MTKLAGVVHFTVTGEFITETARRLWEQEDEPEKALNILKCLRDGDQGITDAQCLDVLVGKFKLVGDSDEGIRLEPDNHKGKTLKQLLRKLKTERDDAREDVQDFAELAGGMTCIVASPTGAREIPRRRARRSGLSDHMAIGLEEGVDFDDLIDDPERQAQWEMLAKKKGAKKPTKKLHAYRRLDNYGASFGSAATKKKDEDAEERAKKEAEEDRKEKELRERLRQDYEAAAQDKITTDTGWLSPEGRFYPCAYAQHARVAYALGHTSNPFNHMVEIEGWLRLSMSGNDQNIFRSGGYAGPSTPIQVKLVKEYCSEKAIQCPFFIEDKQEKK